MVTLVWGGGEGVLGEGSPPPFWFLIILKKPWPSSYASRPNTSMGLRQERAHLHTPSPASALCFVPCAGGWGVGEQVLRPHPRALQPPGDPCPHVEGSLWSTALPTRPCTTQSCPQSRDLKPTATARPPPPI